jgi:Ca-activated chloride channel homolog
MNRRTLLFAALVLAALAAPALAGADGFIIIEDPPHIVTGHFTFAPLEVRYHRVDVRVNELVAVTAVDEEFFNPNDARLEGTYIFPLPEGAHIDRFSMDIAGKMQDAELLSADKARAYYEEIVRKAKDPALLEYIGRGAFKLRIFPIEPHAGKRVKISYTELLKSDAGRVEYTYPLNTEKFSSAALREVSLRVTLEGSQQLKSVYCPTHPVEIRRDGDRRAVVGWEDRNVWPDTDFKLIWSRTPNPLGIDFMTYRAGAEDGYFMLIASPGVTTEKGAVQPKDICFVLDTSGSMAGAKLEQAKKALKFCLANLGTGDRFEIVRFSTEAEPRFGALVPADSSHVSQANEFIDGLRPIGGTAIGDALSDALALRGVRGGGGAGSAGRPYIVIFLTDGLPTVGETGEDALVASLGSAASATRIFSFGIGTDVNTHLLDRIASKTRAVSQYVLPSEDIEVKVSSFYSKIKEPVLTDVALSFTNPAVHVTQLMPGALPDLFNGDMLVVFGRYSGSGAAAAKITGTFNGKKQEFAADVSFPSSGTDNSFIPRLWATRRVGWLLDEIRMHGESGELKDEVVRLAREFGIVTPYTAYLIMEDEAAHGLPVMRRTFQELEEDRDTYSRSKSRLDSVRKEASTESSRAGAGAVANSMAVQDMMQGTNLGQAVQADDLKKPAPASPPAEKSGYRAAQARNYAAQVQVVNGRAFYQNGSTWMDSTAQGKKSLRQVNVKFGSAEYFEVLKRNPGAAAWLALGSNVDVVVDGTLVSVRE